jgi:hypothetical protein
MIIATYKGKALPVLRTWALSIFVRNLHVLKPGVMYETALVGRRGDGDAVV